VLILLLWNNSSNGQTFTNVSDVAGFSVLSMSDSWGNGVSFFDVDEDGWDDLTVCVSNAPTRFYRNIQGTFELNTVFFNDIETKACVWLDIDEDGDNDLFVSRHNGPHQVFENQGDLVFENVSAAYSNLYNASDLSWGVAFGDFTRDGFLDIAIANYGIDGAANILAQNSGQGTFQVLEILGVTTPTNTSFQPTWIDLNEDLLQDLYIINDHNQGNEYYVQTAPGVFEDLSLSSGLNIPTSAMSNSWCDFDRDGDMDLYITNTIQGNRLMENNGENVFTDKAADEGIVLNAWSWSALWIDADNDGWEDLHVASKNLAIDTPTDNFFFKNEAGDFIAQQNSGLANHSFGAYASAKGDFNNDGKSDVVLLTEANVKYKLYQNQTTTSNNYFKFRLEGRLSNRNGIGTFYEYWIAGQRNIGYTYCGESYLTQNSQNIILGIGEALSIDSMRLHWLSGVEDVHHNIVANTYQVFTEGETKPVIVSSKDQICPDQDTVHLSLSGWPVVMWEDGSFNPTRTVTSSGNYSANVSTGFGHALTLSKQILDTQFPSITTEVTQPSCEGMSNGGIHAMWVNELDTLSAESLDLMAGNYVLPIAYGEGCTTALEVAVMAPLPIALNVSATPAVCFGAASGAIQIEINGGTTPYNWGEGNLFVLTDLAAGEYNGIVSDANGCESNWNATIEEPTPIVITAITEMPSAFNDGSIVLSAEGGVQPYSFDWSNGFQLEENINLQEGEYAVTVTDNNGCTVDSSFSLIYNFIQPLNPNTMNWTLQKDGLHYDGSETLHHVFVYDAVGKLLHREQIMAGHTTIPMDAIGPLFILSHESNWKSSISLD
jgi:hypothetical protein